MTTSAFRYKQPQSYHEFTTRNKTIHYNRCNLGTGYHFTIQSNLSDLISFMYIHIVLPPLQSGNWVNAIGFRIFNTIIDYINTVL